MSKTRAALCQVSGRIGHPLTGLAMITLFVGIPLLLLTGGNDWLVKNLPSPDGGDATYWAARLADPRPSIRYTARVNLIDIGETALPSLVEAVDTGDSDTRLDAMAAIQGIAPKARIDIAVHVLIKALTEDPSPRVREYAIGLLRLAGPAARAAIPFLEKAASQDENREVRASALKALGQLQAIGQVLPSNIRALE